MSSEILKGFTTVNDIDYEIYDDCVTVTKDYDYRLGYIYNVTPEQWNMILSGHDPIAEGWEDGRGHKISIDGWSGTDMTAKDVLSNLEDLIDSEVDYDDIICAFRDFEEFGESYVITNNYEHENKIIASIDHRDSTNFVIKYKVEFDDDGEPVEIITDVYKN